MVILLVSMFYEKWYMRLSVMTEQTKNEAKAAVQYSYSDDGCAWG